jgi:hypothetical protein
MYKKLTMLFALVIVMSLMLTPVFAKGKSGQAGKSNVGHLSQIGRLLKAARGER